MVVQSYVNMLMTTELSSLNGCIVEYVNYINRAVNTLSFPQEHTQSKVILQSFKLATKRIQYWIGQKSLFGFFCKLGTEQTLANPVQ